LWLRFVNLNKDSIIIIIIIITLIFFFLQPRRTPKGHISHISGEAPTRLLSTVGCEFPPWCNYVCDTNILAWIEQQPDYKAYL